MSSGIGNRAYLSLGSNIEAARNLPDAVEALKQYGEVIAVSQVWESPPVDGSNQANYLNAAVLLHTQLSAEELCRDAIRTIEQRLKRTRGQDDRFAPRTIDIDLSLFNDQVGHVDHRHIPDPDIVRRAFVAVPLAQLDPHYTHPENEKSLVEIAEEFDKSESGMQLRSDVVLSTG